MVQCQKVLSQSLKNKMSLTVVMVLYELKMKVEWYLLYRCLKLTSVCMLLVTCDNIILLYAQYLRNNVRIAHVYSATQVQCTCNVSFHIIVVTVVIWQCL